MNISKPDDPFYRYKRPKTKLTFRRDVTSIDNSVEICKALGTNEKILAKFLGKISSAASSLDKGTIKIKRLMTVIEVDNYIQTFIDNYILCPSCNNPETVLNKDGKKIISTCKACGSASVLKVDDKFHSTILNLL